MRLHKYIGVMIAAVFSFSLLLTGCGGGAKPTVQYPTKPIQVVVPAGAGGDTDTNARIFAKYLEKELGKPIVIVNAGGAGGTAGTRKVKDAPADGYTVLTYHNSLAVQKAIGLTDFSLADFEVANVALLDDTNVYVVNANSPYKSMQDVVAASKANPKSVKLGTEVGNLTHLWALAIEDKAGIKFNIVDAGAAAAKIAALMGNQIDIIPTQYGLVKQYVDAGNFRAIGILNDKRHPQIPDVPTFKEQGIDVAKTKYFFYAFPKGTPKEIVEKFNVASKKVSENPEYKAEMAKFMLEPVHMPTAKGLEYVQKDEVWVKSTVEKEGLGKK